MKASIRAATVLVACALLAAAAMLGGCTITLTLNSPPQAAFHVVAGGYPAQPFILFDASESRDPDRDALIYEWRVWNMDENRCAGCGSCSCPLVRWWPFADYYNAAAAAMAFTDGIGSGGVDDGNVGDATRTKGIVPVPARRAVYKVTLTVTDEHGVRSEPAEAWIRAVEGVDVEVMGR